MEDLPLINLPKDSVQVSDPDEEIFLLYTTLRNKKDDDDPLRGLGSVDSKRGILNLQFEVTLRTSLLPTIKPGNKWKANRRNSTSSVKVLQVELHQNTTALRSRAGDTGSVLWQASVDLARLLLNQVSTFLDLARLAHSHVLELGAGTGLLPIVLSPFVQRYTVTDLDVGLSLIRKNLSLNVLNWEKDGKIFVEPCDWDQVHSTSPHSRIRYFPRTPEADLLLIVDCIFNPALVEPLVATMTHYALPNKTLVMVMMELRSHEVVQEFLSAWLGSATWKIWRVGGNLLHPHYALWIGCKRE